MPWPLLRRALLFLQALREFSVGARIRFGLKAPGKGLVRARGLKLLQHPAQVPGDLAQVLLLVRVQVPLGAVHEHDQVGEDHPGLVQVDLAGPRDGVLEQAQGEHPLEGQAGNEQPEVTPGRDCQA